MRRLGCWGPPGAASSGSRTWLRVARVALAGVLACAALAGCDAPTTLLVTVQAPDSVKPDALVVSVFSPTKALALAQEIAPIAQLGRLHIALPAVDQRVRVAITARASGQRVAVAGGSEQIRSSRQAILTLLLDPLGSDVDGDGVIDTIDNCPSVANPDQHNTDGTGDGDACTVGGDLGVGFVDLVGADFSGLDLSVGPSDLTPGPDLALDRTPRLWSVHPRAAKATETIYLEGRFGSTVEVLFPKEGGGLSSVTATVLGASRCKAIVPADAAMGELSIVTGGERSNGLPFRRLPFSVSLGRFYDRYPQSDVARRGPALLQPRASHSVWASSRWLYVLGGAVNEAPTATVERAMINADGTLGEFEPGPALTQARDSLMLWELAGYVYVASGTTVERAPINPDGSLGSFALTSSTIASNWGRGAAVVAGSYVYLLGGFLHESDYARAPIDAAGNVGDFVVTTGVLPDVFIDNSALTIGNYIYIIGRYSDGLADRAPIQGDGTLGPWESILATNRIRQGGAFFELGGALWAVGGNDNTQTVDLGGNTATDTVEGAALTSDGSLGTFQTHGATTVAPMADFRSALIGNYLYLIGGRDGATMQASKRVQVATIQDAAHSTGGLGTFAATTSTLPAVRALFASATIGDHVYLIGGHDATFAPLATIDVATVRTDGTLSPFQTASSALLEARQGPSLAILGRRLYVLGGAGGLTSIERAQINEDGTIGAFDSVTTHALLDGLEGMSGAIVNNTYYLLSGEAEASTRYRDTAQSIELSGEELVGNFARVTGTLPRAASYAGSVLIGNRFYLIGGWAENNPAGTPPVVLADFSVGAPAFSLLSSINSGALQRPYRVVGDELVSAGGVYSDQSETASIGLDGTITTFGGTARVLAMPRWRHSLLVVGNSFYVLGGIDDTSTPTAGSLVVERALLQ